MTGPPQHIHTVPLEPMTVTAEKGKKEWHLLTGGISGGISRTVTAPLERLKILRQLDTPEFFGLSLWECLKKFYTVEGIKGFLKGNGSNVIKIVPFSALEFYCFEFFKNYFCPANNPRDKVGLLLSGSCAGIVATLVTYPMDFVRTVLSIQVDNHYKGIWDAMSQIYRKSGILALYRGLGMSCLGIAPFIGFKMTSFDILKGHYLPKPTDPSFALWNLALGSLAGTISTTLTYPTDVIRRKMQLLVSTISGVSDSSLYLYLGRVCAYLGNRWIPRILQRTGSLLPESGASHSSGLRGE